MVATAATRAWLSHPQAGALARFNVLPSLFIHPLRIAGWPPGNDVPLAVHRHWSAALLKAEALEPVLSLDEPALRLALLPQETFMQLMLLCGIRLNAMHVRRAIARTDVDLLRDQLGDEGLAAARTRSAPGMAGTPSTPDWTPARARELCELWGAGLLARAFDGASPALLRRVALRLPEAANAIQAQLAAVMQPSDALALASDCLNTLDPAWLSSFPAAR